MLEKELKIVPQKFYEHKWLSLGMSVYGILFGVALGALLKNMSYIAIGLPIGRLMGKLIAK